MTSDEIDELKTLLTVRAVASRLRGNRQDDHLDFAKHLLESMRAAIKDPTFHYWGNITESSFKNEGQDHHDMHGDIVARTVRATHHTITFTYRN